MDEHEFHLCFEDHFDDVWRFARRRSGSSDVADDLAAETFAIAWRRRVDLPVGPDVRLWLFGTARLVIANHSRSELRRSRLQGRLTSFAQSWSEPPDPTAIDDPNGDVHGALATLSPDERDVLTMLAWDDLAVHEIAVVLGCTPNAVSLRLHKARRRMAAALGKDLDRSWTGSGRPLQTEGDPR